MKAKEIEMRNEGKQVWIRSKNGKGGKYYERKRTKCRGNRTRCIERGGKITADDRNLKYVSRNEKRKETIGKQERRKVREKICPNKCGQNQRADLMKWDQ